jgi:hypothetical protein
VLYAGANVACLANLIPKHLASKDYHGAVFCSSHCRQSNHNPCHMLQRLPFLNIHTAKQPTWLNATQEAHTTQRLIYNGWLLLLQAATLIASSYNATSWSPCCLHHTLPSPYFTRSPLPKTPTTKGTLPSPSLHCRSKGVLLLDLSHWEHCILPHDVSHYLKLPAAETTCLKALAPPPTWKPSVLHGVPNIQVWI